MGAGAMLHVIDVWGRTTLQAAVLQYFVGTTEAAWLSLSMLIFILAGVIYGRAYRVPPRAGKRLVQYADLVAGLAAIPFTLSLIMIGEGTIALVAGAMLGVAKLGSAVLPVFGLHHEAAIDEAFRKLVILSRLPSILALLWAIGLTIAQSGPMADAVLPVIMTICFFLWLWADLLLISKR
ncbi:MAG: hypothetical protein AAGB10_15215 [Pseudomonadota bacterium]